MENAARMSESPSTEEMESLRDLVPLHTLPDDALADLSEHVVFETIKKGQILFNEGDTDHENVYLVKGKVVLLSGRSVVERIVAGTDTARFPLAHQLPRKFSARADSKVRITRIDSRQLSDILARSQTVDYQVADFDEATEDDWMSMLLQSRVLQQVPASNIQRVMMSVEHVEVEKGTDLIRQGDPGDFYYMLTKGRSVVRRDNGDGNGPVELATLGPGDAFGEEALLSDSPRNSTVTMLQDGNVLRLSKEHFLQLIHNPLLDRLDMMAAQAKVDNGAIWLDLRSGDRYDERHLDGAINFPFESLRYQAASLAPDRHYVVYSDTGARAMAGAFLLTERGFDISVLEGGLQPQPQLPTGAEKVAGPEAGGDDVSDDGASDAMRQRASHAEERAQHLEARLEEAQRDQGSASNEHDLQMRQVQQTIDQARRKIAETVEQKRAAQEAREQAYGEIERLTSNLEKLQNERSSLLERASEIEGLDKQLQNRLAKAERELIGERERAESATQSLEELSDRLKEELQRREEERSQHALQRGELKEELTALHLELEQANADLEELQQKLTEQSADGESLHSLQQQMQDTEQARTSLLGERDALQQQVSELTSQVEQISGAHSDLEQREQQTAATQQTLQEQLEAAVTERDSLKQQFDELQSQLDHQAQLQQDLEGRDRESAQALQQMQGQLEAAQEARDDLQGQLADLQSQLDQQLEVQRDLEGSGAQTAAALEQLQQQLDAASAERDTLHEQLAESQSQLEQQAATQQELTNAAQEAATERDDLRRQLETLSNERDALQTQVHADAEQAQSSLDKLQAELDELRSKNTSLQTELASGNQQAGEAIQQAQARSAELETRIADKQAELDALSTGLSENAAALEEVRQARAALLDELEQLRPAHDEAGARITALEQQIEAAAAEAQSSEAAQQAEIAQRDEALAELRAGQGADAEALDATRAELAALQARFDEAGQSGATQLQTLQDELAQARQEREAVQARLDENARESESARQQADARIEELEQQLSELESELDASRTAASEAFTQTESHNAERAHLQSQIESLRSESQALRTQLDDVASGAETGAEHLQAELTRLGQRLEERELALAAAHEEQAELIEALNAASTERETLQLAVSDRDDEQARLVDLENQVAEALRIHQNELLNHEQAQHLLQEKLDRETERNQALTEEVERLTELVEEDAATAEGDVSAQRDALQAELALRESEVEQLRGVIEEYVDQIRAAQSGGDDAPSEIAALRAELEMVREQAIRDVAQMREQLAAAETQKRRLQQADGREAISHEAMRQKIEELESSLSERQRDLIQAGDSRHMLEDQLEDANRKLDEVRREMEKAQAEADEAVFTRREAENAREQLQKALQELQENAEDVKVGDLRDERMRMSNTPIGIDSVAGTGRFKSALIGALVVFGGLEAASFATGNGELVSLLLRMAGQ